MKNKKIIIAAVILFLISILFCVAVYTIKGTNDNNQILNNSENLEIIQDTENNNTDNEEGFDNSADLELTGEKYVSSKIYDENNNEVELSEFSDKPMVLLFFNNSEFVSYEVLGILQNNYENYKEDINFVNIAVIDGVTETKEKVGEYVKSNNITMPVVYDLDYSAKNEYEINKIPTLVFINKNNEIINTVSEDINEDVIQANLDILAENY